MFSDILTYWVHNCLFSFVARSEVGLVVEEVVEDFDVQAFERFQMAERSCHEVEIDSQVVVGGWEVGSPEVLEFAGVHRVVDNSDENETYSMLS